MKNEKPRFQMIAVYTALMSFVPLFVALEAQTGTEIRDEYKKYFDEYKVRGSFLLFDNRMDRYIVCNESQRRERFIPASTFKICNSLIGLETGVIRDENFVIPWDGISRFRPEWNNDHDLKTAFRNSTVWYYQELARRVGGERMKKWLDRAGYGNSDTTGGIDKFWLSGGLRISPQEQVDFLRRLYGNELPFSRRTMEIVKKIMIAQDTLGHLLRAKTGWSDQKGVSIGWYVGYIETGDDVYFFASCIQCDDTTNPDFGRARIEIPTKILRAMKLL